MRRSVIALGVAVLFFQGASAAEKKMTLKDTGAAFLGNLDKTGKVFVTCKGDKLPVGPEDQIEDTDLRCDGKKGGGINPYGLAPDRPQTPGDKPDAGSPQSTSVSL